MYQPTSALFKVSLFSLLLLIGNTFLAFAQTQPLPPYKASHEDIITDPPQRNMDELSKTADQ
jgi:hypothetical protein